MTLTSPNSDDWFALPSAPEQGAGLRFSCTMCGNCCSGPAGFVLVNDTERTALAARLNISEAEFTARYTTMLAIGRSLIEKPAPDQTHRAMDCIFLDREKFPGKAVCGVYEDRPRQCRTWPFWNSTLQSPESWDRASRTCPGINKGPLHELVQIRISRHVVDI